MTLTDVVLVFTFSLVIVSAFTLTIEKGRRLGWVLLGTTVMLSMMAVVMGSVQPGWSFAVPLALGQGASLLARWRNPERKQGWWQTPAAATTFFVGAILCMPPDHGWTETAVTMLGLVALFALALKGGNAPPSSDTPTL